MTTNLRAPGYRRTADQPRRRDSVGLLTELRNMNDKPKPTVDRTLKPLILARILPGVIAYVFDHRVCIHGVTVKQQCEACAEIAVDSVAEWKQKKTHDN